MKDKKHSIFLILAITILLSVLSIAIYYNKNVPKVSKTNPPESKEQVNNSNTNKEEVPIQTIASIMEESPKDNLENQFGNVSGNLAQGGFLAGDDNFIYFSLGNADKFGLYSSRPNLTTAFRKISNLRLSNLNIVGNRIYYLNKGLIMSSFKDGKDEKLIYPEICNYFISYNGRLYAYSSYYNKLISLNLDGKDEQDIMELKENSFVPFLQVKGYNLYFAYLEFKSGQSFFTISSYNMNTKKITKMYSYTYDFISFMQMDGNYIYFVKSNKRNSQEDPRKGIKLLRLNVENNKLETVIENLPLEFTSFVVQDNIVYYSTTSVIYKHIINENNTIALYKNKEIIDLYFNSIYILKDRLYIISGLYSTSEHLYLLTLKTNGSDVVIVE